MKISFETFAQRPAELGPFVPDRCRTRLMPGEGPLGGSWFLVEIFAASGEGCATTLPGLPGTPPAMEEALRKLMARPQDFRRLV